MKKMDICKRLGTLAVCTGLVCGTALAANLTYKNISVQYCGIQLIVDGAVVTPTDSNGAKVEPFIYNGTTYLPVRAVGQAVGKQVSWDGNSKTVYIGDGLGQKTYLMDVCPPYDTNSGYNDYTNGSFQMTGKTYSHGFVLYYLGSALFNLDSKYSTLSFDFGHKDDSDKGDGVYEIYLDGQLAETISAGPEDLVKHYEISLNRALQMKIVSVGGSWGRYGFANMMIS